MSNRLIFSADNILALSLVQSNDRIVRSAYGVNFKVDRYMFKFTVTDSRRVLFVRDTYFHADETSEYPTHVRIPKSVINMVKPASSLSEKLIVIEYPEDMSRDDRIKNKIPLTISVMEAPDMDSIIYGVSDEGIPHDSSGVTILGSHTEMEVEVPYLDIKERVPKHPEPVGNILINPDLINDMNRIFRIYNGGNNGVFHFSFTGEDEPFYTYFDTRKDVDYHEWDRSVNVCMLTYPLRSPPGSGGVPSWIF